MVSDGSAKSWFTRLCAMADASAWHAASPPASSAAVSRGLGSNAAKLPRSYSSCAELPSLEEENEEDQMMR